MDAVLWKIKLLAETEDNVWMQMLVFVIIAALWGINAYLQTVRKKQAEKEFQSEDKQVRRIDRGQLEERIVKMRQARAEQYRMKSVSSKTQARVASSAYSGEKTRIAEPEPGMGQGFEIKEKPEITQPETGPMIVQAYGLDEYNAVSGQKLIKDHMATDELSFYGPLVNFAGEDDLKNAIIYSEILGKCIALRE